MNRQRANGMILIAFIMWAIIFMLVFLTCGCTTKRTVTETLYVHDTVHVSHTDTVREIRNSKDTVVQYKNIVLHDTIIHENKQVIVLNEQGDTIRQKEWDNLYQKLSEQISELSKQSHNESDSILKHQNDSLKQVLDKEREKHTIKTKTKLPLDGYLLFLFVAGALCAFALYKKKDRKGQ